jgi:hypothetical protein
MIGESKYSEYHVFGISKDGLILKEVAILLSYNGKLYQKKSGPFNSLYDPLLNYSGMSEDGERVLYGYEIPTDVQTILREKIDFTLIGRR